MPRTTTMTVRISGTLSDFVAANVSENGSYENISEYVRDLIRRDKDRFVMEAPGRLGSVVSPAFAAPEASHTSLTARRVNARTRACWRLTVVRRQPLTVSTTSTATRRKDGVPIKHIGT